MVDLVELRRTNGVGHAAPEPHQVMDFHRKPRKRGGPLPQLFNSSRQLLTGQRVEQGDVRWNAVEARRKVAPPLGFEASLVCRVKTQCKDQRTHLPAARHVLRCFGHAPWDARRLL